MQWTLTNQVERCKREMACIEAEILAGKSRSAGIESGALGLARRVGDFGRGTETRKAAGVESGGRRDGAEFRSAFDGIAALSVLALGGYDGQVQLLAHR